MDHDAARAFVARNRKGILATIKRNGLAQLSNVVYFQEADGTIKISTTETRAKTLNVRRDARASLSCQDEQNWYSYVVVEGTVTFIDGDNRLAELRSYYTNALGKEHPNWEEYDQAMIAEKRLLLVLHPRHYYGIVR